MMKFSIITVCLNSEKTIKRCLDSVANQTYIDFEHIVIDGVSNDKTLQIVGEFENVICVSEKDKGIYDAMNKGANIAKGEYVLFLNSDDEFLPNFLFECDKVIDGADFVSSAINMVFNNKVTKWTPKAINNNSFIWRMPIPHAGLIVKNSVFKEIGGFDLKFKITSDFDFVVKLFKGSYLGIYNEKGLFNFYMGGVSQDFKVLKENHKVRLKHFDNIFYVYLAYGLDYLRYVKYVLMNYSFTKS